MVRAWSPQRRRRVAFWAVVSSLVLAAVDVGLFALGRLSDTHMLLQTLVLSWLAITFTAVDILATADVRAEQDEDDDA